MNLSDKFARADWGGETFHLLRKWRECFLHLFYTQFLRCTARMMGIKLGKKVSFNGHALLDRFKHSTISIGDNCTFNSHVEFNPRGCRRCIIHTANDFSKIIIGNDCGFSGTSIVAHKEIVIGNNVMVGADTQIGDTDDHNDILGTEDASVIIGNNVFIGMHCMILKGVTIGDNSIIAAGSIVTKDIPANSIAGGVPCKVIKSRI